MPLLTLRPHSTSKLVQACFFGFYCITHHISGNMAKWISVYVAFDRLLYTILDYIQSHLTLCSVTHKQGRLLQITKQNKGCCIIPTVQKNHLPLVWFSAFLRWIWSDVLWMAVKYQKVAEKQCIRSIHIAFGLVFGIQHECTQVVTFSS